MKLEQAIQRLVRRIESLELVVRRQSVRLNNIFREGTITSVDPATGTAIVDAQGVKTKPVPWLAQAGSIVEWVPPEVGQRVVLVSPSGDLGRSFIMPGGFTDDVPQPHDKTAERRTKIGDCVLTQSSDGVVLSVAGTSFTFGAGGFVQAGGSMEHDGKNVGATHRHTDVLPGSGRSGLPTPPD